MSHRKTDPLLVERGKTHGDWGQQAEISQRLKNLSRNPFTSMKAAHREAIEMICMKLSRIICGDSDFKDHWDDIAGYAKLGSDACEGQ